jgi:hypothetical protein
MILPTLANNNGHLIPDGHYYNRIRTRQAVTARSKPKVEIK